MEENKDPLASQRVAAYQGMVEADLDSYGSGDCGEADESEDIEKAVANEMTSVRAAVADALKMKA